MRTEVAGLKLGAAKCHLGIESFNKFTVCQDSLRNPEEIRDYSHYKTGEMKKDDRLAIFVISWILMSRGSNHAQATTEDLYLLKAIKENILVDWLAAIFDNMLKVTRLESAMLPYCVFISKILIQFGVDYVSESSGSYGRNNMVDKAALHRMSLQHTPDGSQFKDEHNEEEATEDESGGEGYTPEESVAEEMQEDESEDEDVAEESNSDMLLRTYLNKKNKKRI
ncbi:hypothetical protein LR48_Vigan05g118100 [Vigna angularis]|uniref:Uncharacterized protein n=1 Tax=Phaseolus angularis TaxID=3914 RepID=A0A0L9ULK5_PHAAN|nr:hypothetical protein LR48_Vigan05g118100 [Vigna angularis]